MPRARLSWTLGLLGVLIIQSIASGMALLGVQPAGPGSFPGPDDLATYAPF